SDSDPKHQRDALQFLKGMKLRKQKERDPRLGCWLPLKASGLFQPSALDPSRPVSATAAPPTARSA
ncbi:uncharacterized protein TrAtP1_007745, partial [Trichoderma atroviride]|uniref:uncharacterized protein n=1 Tax=Hypocrea atroviridis TaxID=63577 RepID=UPI0033244696